jgi:hypothetical protein
MSSAKSRVDAVAAHVGAKPAGADPAAAARAYWAGRQQSSSSPPQRLAGKVCGAKVNWNDNNEG